MAGKNEASGGTGGISASMGITENDINRMKEVAKEHAESATNLNNIAAQLRAIAAVNLNETDARGKLFDEMRGYTVDLVKGIEHMGKINASLSERNTTSANIVTEAEEQIEKAEHAAMG